MSIEWTVLLLGFFLLAAVFCSKLADKCRIPALLFFLSIGMFAGSEGFGGIAFDDPVLVQWIGSLVLMIILFNGGLSTDWLAVKPILVPGLVLSTVGVVMTTILLGSFAWFMLGTYSSFNLGAIGLTGIEALLLAALISSTDAAAVFSVYRTSPVQPKRRLRYLLEFESGSNDPMAVLLTTILLGLMIGDGSTPLSIIGILFAQFVFGGVVGAVIGYLGVVMVNKMYLSATGLFPILVFALSCLTFGLSDLLHGNSFLAVYVAGLIIGNGIKRYHNEIVNFYDGLDWLVQILMFIMLGLLVFPSQLLPVAGVSIALALFLIFVARPLSTVVCLLPFRPQTNELAYVSWVGLRGAVPIVLSTFPISYGIKGADQIFNVIFFVVLISLLVQGLTLVPAARWLNVTKG